mgnify:CR=1 FL=1
MCTSSPGQQVGGDLSIRLAGQSGDPVSMRVVGVRGLGEAAVLLSLVDSTEETRLKRQVAQATKMQAVGQLAGGVAHDFNNVLTAVIGTCDLMLLRHTPGDSDYDDIQQIRANSNRAAALTRQLLAFSRQQTLRPEIIQLPDVVSEVSPLIKRLLGEKITYYVQHDRNLGPVRADPQQLYLPPVMDPVYGYHAINVEAQARNPHSLLNFTRRLIAMRRSFRAFGRGDNVATVDTANRRNGGAECGEFLGLLRVFLVARATEEAEIGEGKAKQLAPRLAHIFAVDDPDFAVTAGGNHR